MKDDIQNLTEKITSYNIFNNLFPGIIFCYLIEQFTSVTLTVNKLLEDFFIYYFIGMVLSRIGSLFIKRIMEKLGIVNSKSPALDTVSYGNYIAASESDSLIKTLNETNNTYRTMIALFATVMVVIVYDYLLANKIHIFITTTLGLDVNITLFLVLCCFLLYLFTLSYKKQSQFINSRVAYHVKTKNTI